MNAGATPGDSTVADGSASERWTALETLFQHALALSPNERVAFLDSSCPDSNARSEVEALIAAHERRGPLDELIQHVMTPLLSPHENSGESNPVGSSQSNALSVPLPTNSRYRILERLGGGGMGIVYRARDERLERDVALKFLPAHLSADEVAKKRFVVEARAAAALEHPNICTVHEIGDTEDGQLYIAMACYDGETLDSRIARGALPVDEALRVATEIARGLAKAHERGIVHRDIKPANVVITSDGLVKILDFGIAKLVDGGATQTVGVAGTIAYMSPEQAFGDAFDHRTDIWSLGVVLYEMLTGVRPFRGPGSQAVLVAALTSDPEPVTRLRTDVGAEMDVLIRRALAKAPAARFSSALEMISALTACSAGVGGAVLPLGTPPNVAPQDTPLTRGGERRQVTVVASAIAGHEALVERLSPDEAERVLARIHDAAEEVATRHGGLLNHFSGDSFAMLFGVPAAHEDDAVLAVRAALALHARVADIAATLQARLAACLRLRSGVHVGPAVAQRLRKGDVQFRITGAPADIAGRLAVVAGPDVVLVSPETRRLVAPFVYTTEGPPLDLQGAGAAVVSHRVLGASDVRSRLEGAVRSGLTPFVGRESERAALAEHLSQAREGTGRLTVLVGEAGAGKSRLLHELHHAAAALGARVLVGRCDSYGGTTPFLPFIEAAQEALQLPHATTPEERHDAAVSAVLAIDRSLEEFLPLYLALLAIPSEQHPVPEHWQGRGFQSAMFEAVAALFTLGSRELPTLLLLEDWHWADEASRAALRQLAEIVSGFPLLIVVTSRPDSAADWGSADLQTLLNLGPLDGAATAAIACSVLRAERVAPELVTRLHERTGGNPFFLEEVCTALREEGAVAVRDGEAVATRAGGAVHVPETVQGVLRTRIDRLDATTRDVLRVAAVIGREFTRGVLEDVVESAGDLARALDRLKTSGLVQQISVAPEPSYRFKHALTQEVAYDSLLEHQRTTLHAAVGRAIEQRYAARLDEHVERLAHHFSCAEAWAEAVRYGLQSADRAKELSQNTEALSTLERVEGWLLHLPAESARRDLQADVLLRQERICELLGLRTRQLAIVEALIELLAPYGPSARLAEVYLRQGDVFTLLHRFEAAELALRTAQQIARERGDIAGERTALRSIALLRSYQGRHAEALADIEQVLALGRSNGDRQSELGDLATQVNVLRAMGESARALTVLREAFDSDAPLHVTVRHAPLLHNIGTAYVDLGDYDTALTYFRRAVAQGIADRDGVSLLLNQLPIGHVLLRQGHVEEALATFRQAVDVNRKARYADGLALACRSLGEALVGLERYEEALPQLREAADVFAQLEERANEALMWRRLGGVHERLGVAEDARAAWTRVRELSRASMDTAGEAEAVEAIARTERQLAVDVGMIIARYEEALALAARRGDKKRQLTVCNSLGIVHWQRGAYPEALRHYEMALHLCRETGDRVHEGLILNSLGATLHRLSRWDEARTALVESVRVTDGTAERQLQAHALATLGDVCLASGRLDEAQASVECSLRLRRSLGDRRGEGWMQERLARVHRAQGAPDLARDAADAALRIAGEIGDGALAAAVTRLSLLDPMPGSPNA